MMRRITVVPYDHAWPAAFAAEASRLRTLWDDEIVAVHHIGSTAVPGLAAKPIVDLLVLVHDVTRLDGYNETMVKLGYIVAGENGIPGRRFFVKGSEEQRLYHIHCFSVDSPEYPRHLAFRDYMRAHPDEAEAYAALKQELARRFEYDAEGYVDGKDAFVKERERRALAWWPGLADADRGA